MPFVQADLDRLDAAIAAAGNASDVSYSDGARIRYLSPGDASRLRDMMLRDIQAQAAADAAASAGTGRAGGLRGFRIVVGSGY